jgi:hypothetical protein
MWAVTTSSSDAVRHNEHHDLGKVAGSWARKASHGYVQEFSLYFSRLVFTRSPRVVVIGGSESVGEVKFDRAAIQPQIREDIHVTKPNPYT